MTPLCTYRAASGRRALVFVAVPDEPDLRMLFDAALSGDGTDVVLVDDGLTSVAEARVVALGWAAEHALDERPVVTPHVRPAATGEPHPLARYHTPTGARIVLGQRIAGEACVIDVPAGEDGAVHLVARGVVTAAELDALVADYVEQSTRRGAPARHADAPLLSDLADALVA